jgi:hypothetical protein
MRTCVDDSASLLDDLLRIGIARGSTVSLKESGAVRFLGLAVRLFPSEDVVNISVNSRVVHAHVLAHHEFPGLLQDTPSADAPFLGELLEVGTREPFRHVFH